MPNEQGLPPKPKSPYKQKFSDDDPEEGDKDKKFRALDEGDIALLKTYGMGPYNKAIDEADKDIKKLNLRINEVVGIKESDTGLAPASQWDLVSDKQMMQEEQPLQVRARSCSATLARAPAPIHTTPPGFTHTRTDARTHAHARARARTHTHPPTPTHTHPHTHNPR